MLYIKLKKLLTVICVCVCVYGNILTLKIVQNHKKYFYPYNFVGVVNIFIDVINKEIFELRLVRSPFFVEITTIFLKF